MADVVVSYRAEERDQAAYVVRLLDLAGFSVWWDQKLVAGRSYDRAVLQEIDACKCVVVCWSQNSIHSDWVRAEAKIALEQDKIIPVMLNMVRIPPPFTMLHTVDLSQWRGAPDDRAWVDVIGQVRRRVDPSGKSAVRIADYSRDAVAKSGHLIHRISAKDSTGRWALYFILVPPLHEKAFLQAIKNKHDNMVDLDKYGTIIASCYGDAPNQEVKSLLKQKYGFDV
jgi:hypothetical protein